ncbi:hypothetical protein NC652_030728 [Populus alba x Populus x berolinensis]|nr:hypothetical protein NC652_030728 [Populus alba x Populus x berolinensis]
MAAVVTINHVIGLFDIEVAFPDEVSPSPLASTSAASFGVGGVLQEFATLRKVGSRGTITEFAL